MRSNKSRDEIEKIVHGVCNILPKTVKSECNGFVNKYADLVIDMLVAEVSPKDICTAISLCGRQIEQMQGIWIEVLEEPWIVKPNLAWTMKNELTFVSASVAECALCQTIISAIDEELQDPRVDHDVDAIVAKICYFLPSSKQAKVINECYLHEPMSNLRARITLLFFRSVKRWLIHTARA